MRGPGLPNATLVTGQFGGANWLNVWNVFVTPDNLTVHDALGPDASFLPPGTAEPEGFLPRACIMGDYNMANNCGWDLNTDVDTLPVSSFNGQNLYYTYLPGMPPKGNCSNQGCPGYPCQPHPVCTPY